MRQRRLQVSINPTHNFDNQSRKSIFECLPNLTYLDSTHSEHYDPDLNINSEEIEQIAPEVLKNLWKKGNFTVISHVEFSRFRPKMG